MSTTQQTLPSAMRTRPATGRVTAPIPSARALRTGRALTAFVALFLFFDGGARVAGFGPYLEGTVAVGFPIEIAPWIGLVLLVSTMLYVLPRTAVLGAILVTGYLGGAVAAHVRLGEPAYFFALSMGVLAWAGLWLREPRLREIIPVRRD